jgi:hypothetical protein
MYMLRHCAMKVERGKDDSARSDGGVMACAHGAHKNCFLHVSAFFLSRL